MVENMYDEDDSPPGPATTPSLNTSTHSPKSTLPKAKPWTYLNGILLIALITLAIALFLAARLYALTGEITSANDHAKEADRLAGDAKARATLTCVDTIDVLQFVARGQGTQINQSVVDQYVTQQKTFCVTATGKDLPADNATRT